MKSSINFRSDRAGGSGLDMAQIEGSAPYPAFCLPGRREYSPTFMHIVLDAFLKKE